MNILSYIHIHRLPSPSGVGRVIDRLLTNHARLYPEHRHRMLVEARLYDQVYPRLDREWKKAAFIPYTASTSLQQARWIWARRPVAECYWKDVDVVYCPAESFVPVQKAKLVCTIHDVAGFEPDLYPDDLRKRIHCMKWNLLFRRMAESAAIVTVSEFSASRVSRFFPAMGPKLRVIHNAPHKIFGSAVDEALRQEVARLSGGRPFVLVPGGLSLRKNAGLILDALPALERALPDVKVLVAGLNEPVYAHRLAGLGTAGTVLCGYVPDELLNALYQEAAAVWFPSRYEGFGMPVVEAMAAGAPVVASRVSSIPEVAGEAALLCGVDDPSEHVEALRTLVGSNAVQEERRRASRAQAARFSWAESAHKLERLFQSLNA